MKKLILPLLLLFTHFCFAQVNLNLGLRAYYPFSGNANDVSGNNNNPNFNNATLTADRFGNPNSAYHFNGTNNYMRIPNSPTVNMGNSMSIALWVKPMGFYTGTCHNNMIVMKGDADFLTGNYYTRFTPDPTQGCITNPNLAQETFWGPEAFSPNPFIQLNRWYSVIWTTDGVTSKIYIDCVLQGSAPTTTSTFTNSFDLFFGRLNNSTFPYWLNGDLDEVRIYNRALNIDEVNTLGGCITQTPCNNWLNTPSLSSYATIGDLDVSGNQITIEATYNRTGAFNSGIYPGHLVSKHSNTTDDNYSLFPNGCAITTTTGYKSTFETCGLGLNKTYHVALVYDGGFLKFYRNGFLMGQVACTGNLITNNINATIAQYAASPGSDQQFLGYVNEVRIWNVARTQAQIQTYMNSSLPNPTTIPGLLGYYTFDNLQNKQGNAAFNATLVGPATINATNSNCTFIADSCSVIPTLPTISNIINTYTPVLGLNTCDNKLIVENASTFNVGDTVLLIQMKGAVIDSTNTATFGTITDYKNAGNYEFNYVKSKAGDVIELENTLTRQYDIPVGKVQLIRVPYYTSVNVSGTLTCLPWDGNKGGVLVVNVRDTLELNADINTSGRGFLKGIMHNSNVNTFTCGVTDYYYADNTIHAAGKGEGITFLSTNRNSGKGPAANGGGGGMNANSGGGGGSNGNSGGRGGYEWNGGCPNYLNSLNWGMPGKNLAYDNTANKIFMGGGGGAGHCNNQFDDPAVNADYNGGNGGGLIIINANYIRGNNNSKIISKGDSAYQPVNSPTYVTHDGMGGGGAGGTVLLNSNNYINNILVDVSGGKGANLVADVSAALNVGPGGGGGGGVVWLKQNSLPANVIVANNGGANGVIVQAGNNPYGAAPGQAGINVFSLAVPFDVVPFRKNIDSVRIKDSVITCLDVDFKGFAYTNTNPINNWQWYFGDGGTANTQNTSHTYAAAGTYTVKLVVTDINGCKDSILKSVIVATCTSTIINDYTPVLAFNPCDNKLTVENGTAYNVGDTVLLIQMKGAVIDSSNTATFGTITDYKNAGNYEFNYVKNKAGNVIELLNTLTRQYDIPIGKVQLIRVPYYTNLTTTDTLTCLPWDGNKGGVLVVNVRDTLELNADINTTGRGFLKGTIRNSNVNTFTCGITDYYYPDNTINAAGKGEGISFLSSSRNSGKGAAANGGGGGMNTNSGGGGGSNGNIGGRGGYEWNGGCPNYLTTLNWGLPGKNLAYNNASNKVFMGGGGGAGHCNNQFDDPAFNADYNGGNGGGIILINADYVKNNAKKIISKGDSAYQPVYSPTYVTHDGMGAGGAGGTVLLNTNNYINNLVVDVSGGKGADMVSEVPPGFIGPGGGGGGGVVWLKQSSLPAIVTVTNAGGANGVIVRGGNDPYGAAAGLAGINVFSLAVPFDVVPFRKNIDSVRIKDSILSCNDFDFKGLAYINTNPIVSWQWYFGDGGQANTQNTTHSYSTSGTYTVKLVVTDVNGCKDSILKDVNALPAVTAEAGPAVSICTNGSATVTLNGSATGGPYLWSPAIYLNNPTIQNPTATISSTTTFYLTVIGSATCTAVDSVTITINPVPLVDTRTDTAICRFAPLVLNTSSNATTFQWSPAANVNNPAIASPNYTGNTSGWMYVTGYFASGCFATDSLFVTVNPSPIVDARTDTAICISSPLVLTTISDATSFQWSPAAYVSNPTIASPNYIHNASGWVYVTGYFASGCSAKDSLYVTVNPVPFVNTRPDTSICRLSPLVLTTSSNATNFQWSPAASVSNANIASPDFIGNTSGWVYITASYATGCSAIDSLYITVNPVPVVDTRPDTAICFSSPLMLNTISDATSFQWTPAASVSNPTIASPDYISNVSGWVYVTGYFASGCWAKDSLYVTVNPVPLVDTRTDTSICRSSPLILTTSSNATSFQWSPAASVSNPNIASPNYIGTTSGWVYVTGSFATGCTATDSLYVTIDPTPVVDTRIDTSICHSSPLVLNTNTDATTIQWSPAASVSNPTIASPDFIGNTSGWVYVTGYFASGCSAKDSLYVTVNPVPFVNSRPDTAICRLSPLVLNTSSNATNFQWSPAASVSNANIASPDFIGNTSGWVYVTGSYATGCLAKDSLYVTVNPLPVVETIADSTLCLNQNITLTTTGAQTYLWSPPIGLSSTIIANPIFTGNNSQTYTVTGTDANGCKNTDVVTITVIQPAQFKQPPPFTICQKESVQLDGNNGTQVSYLWSPATYLSSATIMDPLANPPQTTLYTLVVTENRCGYDSTFTTLLTVVPAPVINARKSNDIDCAFRSATLFASGGNQYLWSPVTGLNNANIANPVVITPVTQTYTVHVTDATGCSNTDTVTVFNKTSWSLARFIPNAFTPNNDGLNDCFGLKNWIYIQKLQFYIFNRFGEQVFATSNPNTCWDGTYKGKPALAGTYVYVIKAQTDCGLEEQKGNFLLIR